MITENEFRKNLSQFTGTENWYRSSINPRTLYTDGAKYLAETCSAYWLLDEIALAQFGKLPISKEEFQNWKLEVKDGSGLLTAGDGNDKVVFEKKIPYTDFPFSNIELWYTGNVIFLPSEY